VGGTVSAVAFSPDGATLLVSAGPPAKEIVRLAVGVAP
jgi:hypothetical protein